MNIFFEVFPWSKNLETGIDLIDEQHQKLVMLLNLLAAHLADRSNPVDLDHIFKELVSYTDYHFKCEEDIWLKYFKDDPWFKNHHHTHESFIQKISELKEEVKTKPIDEVLGGILGFLTHWLAYHILDTDKRMAKVVQALDAGYPLDIAKNQADNEMSGAMKTLIDTVLNMYDSLSSRTMDLLREKSERIRAEEALKESEQRWKFLLDESGDEVWDWNISEGYVYRSNDYISLPNLIPELPEKKGVASIHPEDLLRFKEGLQKHLDGKSDIFTNEHRIIHDNGNWSWVLTRGKVISRDSHGTALHMMGTHTNITEREMASMVFNNTNEGMLITDKNNNIISVNPAYTKITGYTSAELAGKNPNILSSGKHDKSFYQSMWKEISLTGIWSGEIWNKHKNGELFLERLNINTITEPNGSVHYRIGIFSDITHQKNNEKLVWQQSNFDALTGLANRNMLIERIQYNAKRSQNTHESMALLIIDLDRFRELNNVHGHSAGDFVIINMAQRLKNCVQDKDTVARMNGGEFAIMLTDLNESNDATKVAQTILDSLSAPFYLDNETVYQSVSIGISIFPDDADDADSLIKNAEQSMYAAKLQGRNRYRFFTRLIRDEAQTKAHFAYNLHKAIQSEQFIIHYQPIVDLSSGAIHKAEALIRWQHPQLGLISPATFIPIAEETGLIVEIGNWVFYKTTEQLCKWREQHDENFQISINKSPLQFYSETGVKSHSNWIDHMNQLGLPGKSLVIEVTEGLMLENNPTVTEQLNEFRNIGFQLSLDDFGTGYSSLSYLHKFDFDYLKIDQSFVKGMTEDSSQHTLCEAIIVMAHKLGLKVIAEGIETEAQRDLMIKAGCDYGQGFLLSKPITAEEFELLLNKSK
ncbi:MAG: bacteriohemerythrin [Methylococcales bacterium]|nr:bacteriohemerythrin [Methylococcales bacterium]